jgi:hypothetical protein
MLSSEDKQRIIVSGEFDLHLNLGLYIRNTWIYNDACELRKSFNSFTHEDEMSSIIIKVYKK